MQRDSSTNCDMDVATDRYPAFRATSPTIGTKSRATGEKSMLTVAHRAENGGSGEDRVLVENHGSRTLAVVADGAGGTGGGAAAMAMACSIAAERLTSQMIAMALSVKRQWPAKE
jgi:hypothetical protein